MIETFTVEFAAREPLLRRAHVGVVGSGDLEVLLEASAAPTTVIQVTTRVPGHRATWKAVLTRFMDRHPYRMLIEIRDAGATPGTVSLRLEQALELALRKEDA